MKILRVAVIVPEISQKGPVIVAQTLVNYLSENTGIQISVFYLNGQVDNKMHFNVPVKRLNRSLFEFDNFDIVHTHGIRPDLFAWLNRKKINYHISTAHNFVFDDLKYTYNKFISIVFGNIWILLWKRCDKLVCLSESMRSFYIKWIYLSKLEVINNGIPTTAPAISSEDEVEQAINRFRSSGLKVIGTACVLTKRKGLDLLLYLTEKEKTYSAVIIGDGKEFGRLKSLAEKLNINNRICFSGFRARAVRYFKCFDIFIMPSRSEGFCLALIEAVQQKVPVVCSDIPVFRELFNEEEVSFFKLENLDSLEEAISEATKTSSQKVELAYKRYLENYTDELMSQKYLELYKSA